MAQRSATPATSSVEVQAFTRLVRASFAVTRELSAQLQADHGLTINAYEALLRLALSPGSRMRRVDLASSLMLTASGVTRLLDGLEREGLVGREACESDRRVTYAVLTKTGRDKLRQADRTHTRQIGELMSAHFDKAQLAQLSDLLARLPGAEPDPDGDKSSQA
jgi:DNA-binding MarR family transcriptional regulator